MLPFIFLSSFYYLHFLSYSIVFFSFSYLTFCCRTRDLRQFTAFISVLCLAIIFCSSSLILLFLGRGSYYGSQLPSVSSAECTTGVCQKEGQKDEGRNIGGKGEGIHKRQVGRKGREERREKGKERQGTIIKRRL